ALQYLCYGNGKRTPYLTGVLFLGTAILPDYFQYYFQSYKIGKQLNSFHQFDFKKLLHTDFETFRKTIFSEKQLLKLQALQRNFSTIEYKPKPNNYESAKKIF